MTTTVTIQAAATVATFINVWTTASAAGQDSLIEAMKAEVGEMQKKPGFVSLSILPSLDGKQLVVYAQWQSREHFERAISSDEKAMESRRRLEQWGTSQANLYRVDSVFVSDAKR